MRSTSVLLSVLVVTALAAGGCSGDPESSPEPSEPTSGGPSGTEAPATPDVVPAERIRLDLSPAIAQPGETPEPSKDHLATARVEPASPGSRVVLQQRRAGGWRTVSRAAQDEAGAVTYGVTPPAGPGSVSYRAMVVNPDGGRVRSKPASTTWATTFRDEFDGRSLDGSKWSYRQLGLYNPEGSRACSISDESAVSVGGGTLELQVRPDAGRRGEACHTADYGTHDYYLNGHVSTEGKFGFTYGIAAARVKFEQGRGQHGAFWLQQAGAGAQVPGRPDLSGAEVDTAEFFGDGYQQGGLASFLYYLNAQGESEKVGGLVPKATKQLPQGDTWWDRYHVFSVEWTPEQYVFRVDGRPTYRSREGVSGVEEFLILSLLSSDWELQKIEPKTLPSSMKVDWVRVWQRDG